MQVWRRRDGTWCSGEAAKRPADIFRIGGAGTRAIAVAEEAVALVPGGQMEAVATEMATGDQLEAETVDAMNGTAGGIPTQSALALGAD